MMPLTSTRFYLPDDLNASVPAEKRGIRRDFVKLMALDRRTGEVKDDTFHNLGQYLNKGDVLVLNNSRTLPAVLKAEIKRLFHTVKEHAEVRLARRLSENTWEVLIAATNVRAGDMLHFSETLQAEVKISHDNKPLQTVVFTESGSKLLDSIYRLGEPVRYEYITEPWGLEYYQTVFASHPGSIEMPSAGRAFTWELLFKLQQKGIKIVFLQLHTGLSYFLDDKWKMNPGENSEEFFIPEAAMQAVMEARNRGNRVIAAGTTVVRALETAARNNQLSGWTNLYIHSRHHLQLADGILTGLHEPEASHLDMLSAFIEMPYLMAAYRDAVKKGYLWHEFGDMNLII
ncbi:S-adenosylmethionine:tRNA ribosyltransferase-isomerase [Peribacillus sp. SCS-37]|uniref:S-adenosylmethionine:tRNA ribosyltransferase-isomerase n=1 Tax=Paraperibacillus esterisolvens TaxID=3115296 RepID=UPI003905C968